jgi:hypothetical protein
MTKQMTHADAFHDLGYGYEHISCLSVLAA